MSTYQMHRKICPLIFFLFLGINILIGQSKWQGFKNIYSDNTINVELNIYIPKTSSCNGGKNFKFKYRLKGKYYSGTKYLNWKMDFIDCNGNLYERQNSIEIGKNTFEDISNGISIENFDDRFGAASIEVPFYDIEISKQSQEDVVLKAVPLSIAPTGIGGTDKIYLGQTLRLEVQGGALGIGAEWIWHENDCNGKEIGRGKTLQLQPAKNTTYSVRAIGNKNQTKCVSKSIIVDRRSSAPIAIMGENKICRGSQANLFVEGGSLGERASWVWYSESCGGRQIGQGENIVVSPKNNTKYFVRAEGSLNKTSCATIEVKVYEKSVSASSIEVLGSSTVCEGDPITLRLNGGMLAPDAAWNWYKNNCGGKPVGTGQRITVKPQNSATYYARAEGGCNNTSCVQTSIQVVKKSRLPSSIQASEKVVKKREPVTLSIRGGQLTKGATWQWFEGSCNGTPIGEGESITVKPKSKISYFVNADGNCQLTECKEYSITPIKRHQWNAQYVKPVMMHLGLGVGLDYFTLPVIASLVPANGGINQDSIEITGLGVQGKITFHPIFNEWLHVGAYINFGIGTTPNILKSNTTVEESYVYTKYRLGAEIAFGIAPTKLLVTGEKTLLNNDFSRSSSSTRTLVLEDKIGTEKLGFGLRIGRMKPKVSSKKRLVWDVIAQFSRTGVSGFSFFSDEPIRFSEWNKGLQFNVWNPSGYRVEVGIMFPNIGKQIEFNEASFDDPFFQIGLLFNRNLFY